MYEGLSIAVVIPALNEEASIGRVLDDVPGWVDRVVVVDNGSDDRTGEVAAAAGAHVVREPRRGYGRACLAGIDALRQTDAKGHPPNPDVVVFLDADYSDDPTQMHLLVDPIARVQADLVIGSRTLGQRQRGVLSPSNASATRSPAP